MPAPPLRTTRFLLPLVAAALLVAGCASEEERDAKSSADVLFEKAMDAMNSGNFDNAIKYFENLEARYPFSNQTKQAQLDLIYCYFKAGKRELTIDSATQFERENPTHPRVDYALYMRGLAQFSGENSWYHHLFSVSLADRPPRDVQESYSAFLQLVQRYPDSLYAPDARQRMVFLRNRLAEYEIHVARYYTERGAWIAALNRASYVVVRYDGSPSTQQALQIMVESYDQLGMPDLAADSRRVLAANFPDDAVAVTATETKPWYQFW